MAKQKIICVSFNCCIDRTLELKSFQIGAVNKARYVSEQATGKAVVIAYILQFLGVPCEIYGFLWSDYKQKFYQRLQKVPNFMDVLEGRTRINTTIIDKEQHTETIIREVGSGITESDFMSLIEKVVNVGRQNQYVVLSGSLPPGIPPTLLGEFVKRCKEKGMKVAVDSSGDALKCAVEAEPDMIKPNRDELRDLVGHGVFDTLGITQAADRLRYSHPGMDILVSDGDNGCYFVSEQGRKHALFEADFPIDVKSTMGAGDALLAGFIRGLYEDWAIDQCLRYAVRVATATLPCTNAGDMSKEILYKNPLNVKIDRK
ncbi:MAG: 1-phosphofructokinase [Streblomastix strix]|uniref:1-phosphofructokinase n=1 Tax=Streblomastix strix TaxID=222440 RepID=A0A5J4WLP6_9EUKA|nr:MAG: 1-phosphofructokinase [Streblomastix strix]